MVNNWQIASAVSHARFGRPEGAEGILRGEQLRFHKTVTLQSQKSESEIADFELIFNEQSSLEIYGNFQ